MSNASRDNNVSKRLLLSRPTRDPYTMPFFQAARSTGFPPSRN